MEIVQIPAFEVLGNYLYVVKVGDAVATVDPAVADKIIDACEARGWKLTHILCTHHHADHVGGNMALKDRYGCTIVGNKHDAARIPGIDVMVEEGDVFELGGAKATIIDVSGHTVGHIAYHFEEEKKLFIGDTVFALGCGRMFEGTPEMFQASLDKIKALPVDTAIYCAHEYTLSNGEFAEHVDPDNAALKERMTLIREQRDNDIATVPSLLSDELATNPFLRTDDPAFQAHLGMAGAAPADVFAHIRAMKDTF